MVKLTLVCWSCGNKIDIEVEQPPMFAFELADMANKNGMLGVIDYNYNRSLVFCDQKCLDKQLTKKGYIRFRPIRTK